jgi:branched-chain amino acid transport system substrate-binding protein
MASEEIQSLAQRVRDGQLSRRTFMKRAAAFGLGGSALAAFLSACGAAATATSVAPTVAAAATSVAPTTAAAATTVAGSGAVPTAAAAATNPAGAVTAVASAVGGGGAGGTIKIFSSYPRTGANKSQTDSVVNSARLALEQVNYTVGNFKIVYGQTEDLDDGTPAKSGNWDAAQESANINKAVSDPDCMIYFGTFNSGAAKVSIPIANQANLLMISPANTYTGLTKKLEGAVEANEPDVYYPNGKRNYCRVCVDDDLQGAAAATYTKELAVKKVYVLDDNQLYGKGLATVFNQTCKKLGIEVATQESIDVNAQDYRSLAQKIKTAGADLVYFGGITGNNAGKLWKDLRSVLGKDFKMMGADGIFDSDWLAAAGDAAEGTYLTFAGVPPEKRTGKGADWYKAYKDKYKIEPESYAIYGYEAIAVVIDGLKRAGKKDRAAIRDAIMGTKNWDGVLGQWSFDQNGDTTLTEEGINQVKNGKFEYIKAVKSS